MTATGYPASYYAASANRLAAYPQLQGEQRADICIIGAGYTGLSAALHLAQKGYSVCLLDAERVGWGASGRNGGQVCQGLNKSHEELVPMVGRELADALWEMSVESVELVGQLIEQHRIDCDLKRGVLHVAAKKRHAQQMQASVEYNQRVLGYQAQSYLAAEEVGARLGTQRFYAGELWQDALHLHPLNYALGLAEAASRAGVQIFEKSRVTDFSSGADTWVHTAQGSVKSDYVLLACNGYLEKLEPNLAAQIMPINNFILATEPLDEELCKRINRDDLAIADSRFVVNYFKLSGDNRLLWGGGETYSRQFPRDIPGFVRKHMLAYYPELADLRIDYGWGGTLAITLNRLPSFARPKANLFAAQGYSGHGVALATLAGKLMAEAISGSAERFDMFAQLPTPRFPGGTLLRTPGLIAGMLFYSMRDRLF